MKKIFSNMKPARMAIMLILALLTVQTVQADPNTTDKTALSAAISEAEEYYTSIKESSPSIASVLQHIINTAKEIKDDDKLTQSDMEFATSILEEVMKQAKDAVDTGINTVNAASRMAEKYYDLNGRRFNGKPSAKGVYINNGNKIVMK